MSATTERGTPNDVADRFGLRVDPADHQLALAERRQAQLAPSRLQLGIAVAQGRHLEHLERAIVDAGLRRQDLLGQRRPAEDGARLESLPRRVRRLERDAGALGVGLPLLAHRDRPDADVLATLPIGEGESRLDPEPGTTARAGDALEIAVDDGLAKPWQLAGVDVDRKLELAGRGAYRAGDRLGAESGHSWAARMGESAQGAYPLASALLRADPDVNSAASPYDGPAAGKPRPIHRCRGVWPWKSVNCVP